MKPWLTAMVLILGRSWNGSPSLVSSVLLGSTVSTGSR